MVSSISSNRAFTISVSPTISLIGAITVFISPPSPLYENSLIVGTLLPLNPVTYEVSIVTQLPNAFIVLLTITYAVSFKVQLCDDSHSTNCGYGYSPLFKSVPLIV